MIEVKPANTQCVLAISFLDYLTAIGGMSKYMMAHEQMYTKAGYSYISIYFVKKIIKKRYSLFHFYGLIIDGKEAGVYTIDELLQYFQYLKNINYKIVDVHIHNISYMNVQHMLRLVATLPVTPFKLIIHDYHTICTSFNLLKNGIKYCGGKAVSKSKCAGCRYYQSGKVQMQNVRKLLENVKDRLTVIAPSNVARKIWVEAYPDFTDKVIVMEEQLWEGKYLGNREIIDKGQRVKIGYLGNKSPHKGWAEWVKFVELANKKHNQYECIVFNSKKDFEIPNMEHSEVKFSSDKLNAMVESLREKRIDCAILWSKCEETYSYTLFEACSANAFIITNSQSGNIAYTISQKGNGLVLQTEEELYEYAVNPDKLIECINYSRKNTDPGPDTLVDNYNFVKLTQKEQPFEVDYKRRNFLYQVEQKALLSSVIRIARFLKINN